MNFNSLAPGNQWRLTGHGIPQLSESQLIAAAKRGRSEAFDALCETHKGRLYRTAWLITRNREDAEDALQDSFLRAFQHIRTFQGKSRFSTLLTRIVINSALMIRRKDRSAYHISTDEMLHAGEAEFSLQIPDGSPNPEQTYVERERKRILRQAISGLRPRIRAVIESGQLHELSIKETAKVLSISVAAAKGRFFHGRAALRRSAALRAVAQARTEPAA